MFAQNNKKGIVFWYIMGFFSIFCFFMFIWLSLGSTEGAIYDPKHEILDYTDFHSSFSIIEKQFIETYLDNELVNIKSNFFRSKLLQNDLGEDTDESSLYSCSINTNPVFYNERVLDFTISSSDLEITPCLIETDLFLEEFAQIAKDKIEEDIGSFYSSNSYLSLDDVESEIDEENGLVNLLISSQVSSILNFGDINSLNEYEKEINLGTYNELLSLLSLILPEFSNKIKTDFISCVDDDEIAFLDKNERENLCYNELFDDIFDVGDYTFEIVESSSQSNSEYIVLNFKFFDGTGNLELEFLSIFRNNVPFGVVEFELGNANYLNNIIEIELTKFISSVASPDKYMVVYSYENFLDEDLYGKSRYDEFIDILENSQIPLGFEDTGYEVSGSKYYHSSDSNSVNLNLLSVSGAEFDTENKKIVPLYQIYNFNSGKYELFESDKQVYVAIFGVDPPGYNYFTDRELLELAFKNLETKTVLGPNPLSSATFIGNIINQQEVINVKINNVDSTVSSYGLYIYRNGEPLPNDFGKECNTNYCYVNVPVGFESNFIITSSDNDFGASYSSVNKLNGFELEHGVSYRIMIVTEDSNGEGLLEDSSSSDVITQAGDFYKLEKSSSQFIGPFKSSLVEVIDRLAPTDSSYSISSSKLNLQGSTLYLQWSPIELDVTSLYAQVLIDNTDTRNVEIFVDGALPTIEYDTSLAITKLSPKDEAGNSQYTKFNIGNAPDITTPITYP